MSQTFIKPARSMFLNRMTEPQPVQGELALPPEVEPDDLIQGPRISLRYGTAPTEIWVSARKWRTMHHVPGRWKSITDYRDDDCLIGKLVKVNPGTPDELVGVVWECDDFEGTAFEVRGIVTRTGWKGNVYPTWRNLEVIEDGIHLNAFEQALKDAGR